ncbi:ABC transporter permease [Chloroflexota bacterium]
MQKTDIYDSSKTKGVAIEELKGILNFKDLLVQLIRRNIITRYKRSTLGIFWTMLNPLGTMIILSIVFSRVFDFKGFYPAFIITNLVTWNFFSQTTQFSLNTTLWGSDLFQRIYMPRTLFVISMNGAGIVNLILALVPLAIIYLATNVPLSSSLILFPFAVLLIAFFTLGVSLLISAMVIFFPDVAELYPVLLQAMFYISPIIFPDTVLQDFVGGWVLKLNPFYYILKVIQMTLFEGLYPSLAQWLTALAVSLFSLVLGWIVFTANVKNFQYYT